MVFISVTMAIKPKNTHISSKTHSFPARLGAAAARLLRREPLCGRRRIRLCECLRGRRDPSLAPGATQRTQAGDGMEHDFLTFKMGISWGFTMVDGTSNYSLWLVLTGT